MNEIETSVFVLERSSQQEIFIILLNDSLVNKQNWLCLRVNILDLDITGLFLFINIFCSAELVEKCTKDTSSGWVRTSESLVQKPPLYQLYHIQF